MGACCNLIGKAVPIAQVSVGPYRLSSIQTSLVSATLEIKSKSLLSPKVADVWHLEAVPVATVSTALDAANHPHVHDKLTKRTCGAYRESMQVQANCISHHKGAHVGGR